MAATHPVFISYASADRAVAEGLCRSLEESGVACWIAPRDVEPGADWRQAILDGLDRARLVVLVFSQAANDSADVGRELERAAHRRLTIVPFRIADVMPRGPLEYHLSTPQWIDAWQPPYDERLAQLVATVRARLAEEEAARPRASGASTTPLRPNGLRAALLRNLLLFAVVGFLALAADVLGLATFTAAYSQDLLNQVLSSWYPRAARQSLAVLLLDDATLQREKEPWPASYAFHAGVLEALLQRRPKAVLVDILFNDPRPDPTLKQLQDVLARYRQQQVPVYLATSTTDARDGLREELRGVAQPVSVPKTADAADRAHRVYDLLAGPTDARAGTAALRLYTDVAAPRRLSLDEIRSRFADPMHVVWATSTDTPGVACRQPPGNAVSAALARFFGSSADWQTDCPYTPTVFVDSLLDAAPEAGAMLDGRIVLYGASLVGTHDAVYPPTHSRLPGVYLHTMALDNLLTFGDDYVRHPGAGTPLARRAALLDFAILVVYGLLFGLCDAIAERRRWRLSPHDASRRGRGAWLKAAEVAFLLAGLASSLGLTYTAFAFLRLAAANWAACFGVATFLMLLKGWYRAAR